MRFQASGSNYNFAWTIKQLFASGTPRHSHDLRHALQDRYGGEAVLYAKGRDALAAGIKISLDEKPGLVVVNGMTCSVVVEAVDAAGGDIIYADIDPTTAHYSTAQLEDMLTTHPEIKSIVVQNTFGRMCDIASIEKLASQHNAIIIEDLAHSIGQSYADGREAGTVGDIVMISFGRDKLLDIANGGALIIRNPDMTSRITYPTKQAPAMDRFRDRIYPMLTWKVRKFYGIVIGKVIHRLMFSLKLANHSADGNIHLDRRLSHWQANLAGQRLAVLDSLNTSRQQRMELYEQAFGSKLISQGGTLRAAIKVTDRHAAIAELLKAGFALDDTWYDRPIGPARKYDSSSYPVADCPESVSLSQSIINLPTHDEVDLADISKMIEIVSRYV